LYPALSNHRAACFEGAKDQATHDLDQLARWARAFPGCNWRVHLGRSKIWALDVDVPGPDHAADGAETLRALLAANEMPRDERGRLHLPMTRSGGGGWCLFFAHEGEPLRGSPHPDLPGLDPLRGEQSATVAPSLHVRTRQPYRWLVTPWETAPKPAPAWLLELYTMPAEPPRAPRETREPTGELAERWLYDAVGRVLSAREGTRNRTLYLATFRMAVLVYEGKIDMGYVRQEMIEAARDVGLPWREAKSTIDGAFKGARNPRTARRR
jgi:hypothetical protein